MKDTWRIPFTAASLGCLAMGACIGSLFGSVGIIVAVAILYFFEGALVVLNCWEEMADIPKIKLMTFWLPALWIEPVKRWATA